MVHEQGMPAMVFSADETTNKALVCAGVPGDKGTQLEVSEWLTAAMGPLNGRCGKGKGGLASGQVSVHRLMSQPLSPIFPLAKNLKMVYDCAKHITFRA